MTREMFMIAAVAFPFGAAAAPPVTFESACSCHGNHGEHRWRTGALIEKIG
jgi:hypothetical protein